MTVSLYRSSCNLFYGHNEGRIGTRTTIQWLRDEERLSYQKWLKKYISESETK
jgi:hypothetical protein